MNPEYKGIKTPETSTLKSKIDKTRNNCRTDIAKIFGLNLFNLHTPENEERFKAFKRGVKSLLDALKNLSRKESNEKSIDRFKTFIENEDGWTLTTYDGRVLLESKEWEEKILEITRETDVLISVKIKSEGKEYYDIYTRNGLYLEKKWRYNEKGWIGNTIVCKIGKINEEFKYSDYQQENCDIRNEIHEKLWEKVKNLNFFETIKDLCLYKTKDDNGMRILRWLHYNGELEELIKIDWKEGDDIEIKEIGKNLLVIKNGKESKLLKIKGNKSNCEILAEGKKIKRIRYEKSGKSHLLNLITVEKTDGKFDVYERKNHELNILISWATRVEEWRSPGNKPSLRVERPNGTYEYIPYGEHRMKTEVIKSTENLLILKYKVKNNKNIYYLVKKDSNDILLETENELEFMENTNFISEKTKNGHKVYIRQNADSTKENIKVDLYKLWEFSNIKLENWELKCYKKWEVWVDCYPVNYDPSSKLLVKPIKPRYNPYFVEHHKPPKGFK